MTKVFVNNAFSLIQFHPSFPTFKVITTSEQEEAVKNISSFINECDLRIFNKIFTSENQRLEYVIKGFELLNEHLLLNHDISFLKFVISGPSTIIDSFYVLSKILKFNELSNKQSDITSKLFDQISELIYCDDPQLSLLPICYGLLEACPSLMQTSMNFQNFLLKLISRLSEKYGNVPHSIIFTTCGLLSAET